MIDDDDRDVESDEDGYCDDTTCLYYHDGHCEAPSNILCVWGYD